MPISISNLTVTGTAPNITVTFDATVTNDAAPPSTTTAFVTILTPGTVFPPPSYTGYVGMKFTMGATPVNVSALGRYVLTGNSQSHQLVLVNATGTVLGTVTVNTAGVTAGQFLYGNLSAPVTLAAGQAYYVLSAESASGDHFGYFDYVVTTTAIAILNYAAYEDTLSGPLTPAWQANVNHPYGPVNFKYS